MVRTLFRGTVVLAASLSLGTAAAAAPAERTAAPEDRVPLTHWTHGAMWTLVWGNFPVDEFDRLSYHRDVTRYQFAVSLRHMLSDAGWPTEGPRSPKLNRAPATDLRAFQQLAEEFSPELQSLGVDVERLRGDLTTIAYASAARASGVLGTSLGQRLTLRPLWQAAPERRTLLPRFYERGSCPTGSGPARKDRPSRPISAPLLLLREASVDGVSWERGVSP